MIFDPQQFKARCSAIHSVMANSRSSPQLTEKQAERLSELEGKVMLTDKMKEEMAELNVKKENGKKIILSDTCIAYLMEEYSWKTQGMVRLTKEVMDVPQMSKGTLVEQDSVDLLSVVDGVAYVSNVGFEGARERVYNDFLSGEIDAFVGDSIMSATTVPDIKSIFDYPTFLCKIHEPLTLANDWQLKGYGDITGCKDIFIANCLVNTPAPIQYDFKNRLLRKMNVVSEESPEFIEKWAIMERSMSFDHIPPHKRVFKKKVEPMTDNQRTSLYDRVKACREWLHIFDEQYQKLNK